MSARAKDQANPQDMFSRIVEAWRRAMLPLLFMAASLGWRVITPGVPKNQIQLGHYRPGPNPAVHELTTQSSGSSLAGMNSSTRTRLAHRPRRRPSRISSTMLGAGASIMQSSAGCCT